MQAHAVWFMALGAACGTAVGLILGLNGRAGLAPNNAPRVPSLVCLAFTEFSALAVLLGGTGNPVSHFAFGTNLGYGMLFGWRLRAQPFGGKPHEKIVHALGVTLALLSAAGLLAIIALLIASPRGTG